VGRLGSGMWVSASFQINSSPVGQSGSGPRVGVGGYLRGYFWYGGVSGELSPGGYLLESLSPVGVKVTILQSCKVNVLTRS